MEGGAPAVSKRQAEPLAEHADKRQTKVRGQAADRVVWLIDELAAGLGVDAVGVAIGADAAAEPRPGFDEMHQGAAPRQLEGRAQSGEAAASDDDAHLMEGRHAKAGTAGPTCVRRWEPRRTGRPDRRRQRDYEPAPARYGCSEAINASS